MLAKQTVSGVSSVQTNFILDIAGGAGGGGLPERLGSKSPTNDAATWYTRGWGQELSKKSPANDTDLWYLPDRLGSVRALMSASGGVATTTTYNYDAYGTPEGTVQPQDYGFTGEIQNTSTSLVHLRARWYSTSGGRFTSRDLFSGWAEQPMSLHSYHYIYDSPVNGTDPTGFDCGLDLGISGIPCNKPPTCDKRFPNSSLPGCVEEEDPPLPITNWPFAIALDLYSKFAQPPNAAGGDQGIGGTLAGGTAGACLLNPEACPPVAAGAVGAFCLMVTVQLVKDVADVLTRADPVTQSPPKDDPDPTIAVPSPAVPNPPSTPTSRISKTYVADTGVFADRTTYRADFDLILRDPSVTLLVPPAVRSELAQYYSPAQAARLAGRPPGGAKIVHLQSDADISHVGNSVYSRLFGLNDARIVQAAYNHGVTLLTGNDKILTQLQSNNDRRALWSGLRIQVGSNVPVTILPPAQR